MKAVLASRPALWLLLALPGVWLVFRWAAFPDQYGYGHAVGDSGRWAAWLLMLTLAITPVRLLFRKRKWAAWLTQRRRAFGVASFAYAMLHTAIYLDRKGGAGPVLADAGGAEFWTGWLALALFLPLAITSNDTAMRAMKRKWKQLHRLVYPAAILTFAHWALSAFDPMTAYLHLGALAVIEGIRIWLQRR